MNSCNLIVGCVFTRVWLVLIPGSTRGHARDLMPPSGGLGVLKLGKSSKVRMMSRLYATPPFLLWKTAMNRQLGFHPINNEPNRVKVRSDGISVSKGTTIRRNMISQWDVDNGRVPF